MKRLDLKRRNDSSEEVQLREDMEKLKEVHGEEELSSEREDFRT